MNWGFFEQLAQHKHSSAIRAVGLALAIRAKDDDPVCWPSITTLCKDASVCRLTVIRAINLFESEGLLKVDRKDGRVNRYRLTSKPQRRVTSKRQRRDQCVTETGYQATTETGQVPRTSKPQRRDQATTETRKVTVNCSPKQEDKVRLDDSEVPY